MILLTFNEFLGMIFPKTILRAVYIVGIVFFVIRQMLKDKMKLHLQRIDVLVIIYAIYLMARFCIQIMIGSSTDTSGIAFLQTFVPIVGYFVAKRVTDDMANRIEGGYVILSCVSVTLGLIDSKFKFLPSVGTFAGGLYGSLGDGTYAERAYSLAGNALITGFICVIGLFFLISNKSLFVKKTPLKIIVGGILFVGLMLTLSRGAMLMFSIVLIVYFLFGKANMQLRIKKRRMTSIVTILCVLVLGGVIKWNDIVNSSVFRRIFGTSFDMSESSNAMRFNFISNAFNEVREVILFGKGFGFTGFQTISSGVAQAINTESYLISLLVMGGIVALILFVLIVVCSVSKMFREKEKDGIKYIAIVIGMFAWCFAYILLDSDLIALIFWYSLGRVYKLECPLR